MEYDAALSWLEVSAQQIIVQWLQLFFEISFFIKYEQYWTILTKIKESSTSPEKTYTRCTPMLFILWIFWISHLHVVDCKIYLVIGCKNIKQNDFLELITFFKRTNQLIPFVICTTVDLHNINILPPICFMY